MCLGGIRVSMAAVYPLLRKSAFKYPDTVKADINFGGSLSEGELVISWPDLATRAKTRAPPPPKKDILNKPRPVSPKPLQVTFGALLGARFPRDLAMKLLQAMRAEAASYKCMS